MSRKGSHPELPVVNYAALKRLRLAGRVLVEQAEEATDAATGVANDECIIVTVEARQLLGRIEKMIERWAPEMLK